MTPEITQHEAVRRALETAGGLATLGYLNHAALREEGSDWSGTKDPFANIRRIVQVYPKLFWRVRPGLWALKSHEAQLRQQLQLPLDNAPRAATEEFDHGYYQGLLLELGRFKKFETTVPAQDKNRKFLTRPLGELASLQKPPAFTFDHLMPKAKTIDVGWYNERQFPNAFFEVEHSTDIQNSLLKFLEFQDFRARFVIVADAVRKQEWEKKMKLAAFASLNKRVEFLTYKTLADMHAHASQGAQFDDFLSPHC